MMTRVAGQLDTNYGQILHQTEQEQHRAANTPQWSQQAQQQAPMQFQYPQQQPQQGPAQYAYPPPQQQQQQQPGQFYPTMQPPGQRMAAGGTPTYDPNVPVGPAPQQGQPQVNFDGMAPWAGMPGCAFETGPPLAADPGGYSVVGEQGQGGLSPDLFPAAAAYPDTHQPSAKGQLARAWFAYKDVFVVVAIVYLLLKYALPQAKRVLPTFFSNLEGSVPATAVFALCVGGLYQGSKKVL